MFRFLASTVLVVVLGVPAVVTAAPVTHVYRGEVTSVRRCYPTGYAFTIGQGTTTLIFTDKTTLTVPKGATPTTGVTAFTIAGASVTCDTDQTVGVTLVHGSSVSYFAVTPRNTPPITPRTPTTTPTQQNQNNGSNTSSSAGSQLTSFLGGELKSVIGSLTQPLSNKLQSLLGLGGTAGAAGAAAGAAGAAPACYTINFGGPVVSAPIFCSSPAGAALVYIGPPIAKPILCLQGPGCMETPYMYGPPLTPGQEALGCHAPALVPCVVGHVVVGLGFPVIAVGTSLPGGVPTPPASAPSAPSTNSCVASGNLGTPAGKAAAEAQVRRELAACGVSINKSACAVGASFQDTPGGCTDVSGLQCGATKLACDLAKKCGPYTISGGSEAGHKTHSPGNALDIVGIDDCIKRTFKLIDAANCIYQDPATGNTFRDEGSCKLENTTGPHFHACVGGTSCR